MNLADHVRKMIAMHSRIHELDEIIRHGSVRLSNMTAFRDEDTKHMRQLKLRIEAMRTEMEQLQAEYDSYRIGTD